MSSFRHLELLRLGPDPAVRLVDRTPSDSEVIDDISREWECIADHADCKTLLVDCAEVARLSSEMLSKLIVLQRRLQQKKGKLILCGLAPHVREVLRWTKLDRFFEIKEDLGCSAGVACVKAV